MESITLLTNRHGDFEVHVTGCADIKRAHYARYAGDNPEAYTGETYRDAIEEMDTEAASWFGEEPYTESSRVNGCWAAANGLTFSPCLVKVTRNIRFEDVTGKPYEV